MTKPGSLTMGFAGVDLRQLAPSVGTTQVGITISAVQSSASYNSRARTRSNPLEGFKITADISATPSRPRATAASAPKEPMTQNNGEGPLRRNSTRRTATRSGGLANLSTTHRRPGTRRTSRRRLRDRNQRSAEPSPRKKESTTQKAHTGDLRRGSNEGATSRPPTTADHYTHR